MTFSVQTFGCKVNLCESAAIIDGMLAAGYEKAEIGTAPDICIINSCAVTSGAVKSARQALSHCKTENPDCIAVLCGCFPQSYKDKAEQLSADIIIGNTSKADIPLLVESFLKNHERRVFVNPLPREFDTRCLGLDLDRTRAFIKVEDGCDRACTYCIIPTARGRVRSLSVEMITGLAKKAAASGNKEIVLTGINLSCYGQDLGLTLSDAVKAADVDGIERIRLGSLEPDMMTDSEIERLSQCEKLCPHFHLSLQSGSDRVLALMRRRYNTEMYREVCKKLRAAFPDCSITTDIMVGFTGEADEDFAETMRFAEDIGFAKIHVFPYSIRNGTIAAMRDGQIVPHIKTSRAKQMTTLAKRLEAEFYAKQIGREYTVLIERPKSKEYSSGFTPSYIPVRIYGKPIEQHSLVKVKITGSDKEYCTAELSLINN